MNTYLPQKYQKFIEKNINQLSKINKKISCEKNHFYSLNLV